MSSSDPGVGGHPTSDRLDSWKEIASYLKRGVTTVQRWERTEGLPVHRLQHGKAGSVHAYRAELDEWWKQRSARLEAEEATPEDGEEPPGAPAPSRRRGSRAAIVASVLALLAAIVVYRARPPATAPSQRVKLAVLPFANLNGNPDDEYLADGVTEEVTTFLARLQSDRLGVIARASVSRYKGEPKAVREVARDLGVDYVLQGSVRPAAAGVRVTAQLIDVRTETHVWAEAFERGEADTPRVEAAIGEAVARKLALGRRSGSGVPSSSPSREAHVAYLKGLYFWNKRNEPALRRAIELFREALDLDPGYAQAQAGLATSYARLATSADALSASEARALAEAGARRALALDPELPEGHAALAVVRCQFDWDWKACHEELARTLALDPNYATGHHWMGEHLVQLGQFDDGRRHLEEARALDPISPAIHTSLGIALMYARRSDAALESFAQALEIDPRFLLAHRVKGLTLVRAGQTDAGLRSLQEARQLDPRSAHAAADLGYALAHAGRTAEAHALLAELHALGQQRRVSAYDFAVVHAGLGENEPSLDWLEKAYAERANGLRWLKVDPIFDGLRAEPRFRDLQRRVGLPD